jgi:RNA polymerase sigma factor (sigma-70 family)
MLTASVRPPATDAISGFVSTPSDEALIRRIAGGDRLAMQALFARHQMRVYRYVMRLVRDEHMAEDVVSDVFLGVWRTAGRFEARSMVSTWLLAIARYKALSGVRRLNTTNEEGLFKHPEADGAQTAVA